MKIDTNKIIGWSFRVDEVSAGVYRACAIDCFGRKVELDGTDPDKLLHECRLAVEKIEKSIVEKNRNRPR